MQMEVCSSVVNPPVWFFADPASSVFVNSTKAVDRNSLSLRKVDDPDFVSWKTDLL